jgi:hypothetical protein
VFLPPLVWMTAILLVASIPGSVEPDEPSLLLWIPPNLQNFLHVPAYAVLSWLWCRSLSTKWKTGWAIVVAALSISLSYASLEELYQHAIPGRYAGWTDLTMDALGAFLGVVLFRRWSWPGNDRSGHPGVDGAGL